MAIIKTPLSTILTADTPIIESLKLRIKQKIKELNDSERLKYNNVYKKIISENNNKKMLKEIFIVLGIIITWFYSTIFLTQNAIAISLFVLILSVIFYIIIVFIPKYSSPSKNILDLYHILNFNLKEEMSIALRDYTVKNINSKSKYIEYMVNYYLTKVKRMNVDNTLIEKELLLLLSIEDLQDPEFKKVSDKLIVETKLEGFNKELKKMNLEKV